MSTEFNYTREWTDAEAFPLLSFTKNWENPDDYPTIETDEQKVRQDMQSLHDEVKDFLNNELIPRVIAEDATVAAWQAAEDHRVENEEEREIAETERVENEQRRGETFDEQMKSVDASQALIEKMTVFAKTLAAETDATVELAVDEETGGFKITFGIPKGHDGDGTGDMKAETYDPQGKAQDVFKYVDDGLATKAPDGYGLGAGSPTCMDCNEATLNGWYGCEGAVNGPSDLSGWGWMLVSSWARSGRYVRQDFYAALEPDSAHYFRHRIDGVWKEWHLADYAPTGYGLGEVGGKVLSSSDDLNTIIQPGFYSWYNSVPMNADGGYRCMTVYSMNSANVVQEVRVMDWAGNRKQFRRFTGGKWSDWEYFSYLYGTTDLTAGSSELPTGELYFVYE